MGCSDFVVMEPLENRRFLTVTLVTQAQSVPFNRVVVDQNPTRAPLEKTMADIEGTGKLDIVIGHDNSNGGVGGIVWYQNPRSGNVSDHWNQYTIAPPGGSAYEDIAAYDLRRNGIVDLIASYKNQIVWFDNPRNRHIDPTTASQWQMHVIGPNLGHEIVLGDFNGDRRIDVATNNHIYLQGSDPANAWVTVASSVYSGDAVAKSSTRSEVGLSLFDSGSGKGAIDLAGTGPGRAHQLGWFENPRDHGGNAQNDRWIFHPISGNVYSTDGSIGVSYATTDVNHDGRQDIITAQAESGNLPGPVAGGLIWWQAPANRARGKWSEHVIDASLQDIHKINIGDVNHDGRPDIAFAEQEQSQPDRVGVIYAVNDRGLSWNEEILSTESGQNQFTADADGDGNLDILNVPHGVYTGVSPVVLFMNQSPSTIAPTITVQPRSRTAARGAAVTFYSVILGSGITYQWQRNGQDIPGATSATYTITSASASDSAAHFRLIATSAKGSVRSRPVVLKVK